MFYADIKNTETGKHFGGIYLDPNEFNRDMFSPANELVSIVDFKVTGKTYAERQNSLRDVAIDFQSKEVGNFCMYMSEWALVSEWFTKMGKRYGLLREFRENAII